MEETTNIQDKVLPRWKSNLRIILNICLLIFFGLAFFSIPVCSFSKSLYALTWVFTLLFLATGGTYICLFGKFKIDLIFLSFVLFSIFSVLSTLINGFHSKTTTAPFLSLFASFCYLLCKHEKKKCHLLFLGAYIGTVFFMFVFFAYYWDSLVHFDFERLGAYFGDINDISLFMFFGYISSLFIIFSSRKQIGVLIIEAIFCLLFFYCGMSSGSRIFIILVFISTVVFIFLFFGKKKWWISLIIILSFLLTAFLVLQLPAFSTIEKRLLSMISTLFGKSIKGTTTNERSIVTRFKMFLSGIDMFLRKPLLGWGISGFAVFADYTQGWSHNNFSESLCNFGLVGTFFFHLPLFLSIKQTKFEDKIRLLN